MFYEKANEKVYEIEKENLPKMEVVEYIDSYSFLAEVMATVGTEPVVIMHNRFTLLANMFYFIILCIHIII